MPSSRSLRILFPEGSSLSAREALSALGQQGYTIDVCDPNPLCVCRFSRFVHTFHRCPSWGTHPLEYLDFLLGLLKREQYDVLLPVHEQAFLFARFREELSRYVSLAVADFNTFALLQSKASFISVLDALKLPHPPTTICHSRAELEQPRAFPYYIKMAYGTAGSSVWRIDDEVTQAAVIELLEARGFLNEHTDILVQDVAPGVLEVVQSVFDHGRLVAAHCYQQRAEGVGGSASARISMRRPLVLTHLEQLGQHLDWHGSLMVDYLFDQERGQPAYIEANPRMGETMNATFSGLNLADLLVQLSLQPSSPLLAASSQPGIRSHILLAVLLGTAIRGRSRFDLLYEVIQALFKRGTYADSREEWARVREDAPSLIPLLIVFMQLLLNPRAGVRIASQAISNYALTEETARLILNWNDSARFTASHEPTDGGERRGEHT